VSFKTTLFCSLFFFLWTQKWVTTCLNQPSYLYICGRTWL
jgi:hypothetical protein